MPNITFLLVAFSIALGSVGTLRGQSYIGLRVGMSKANQTDEDSKYTSGFLVGDTNESIEEAIKLYPNPANDVLWLSGLTSSQLDYGTCQILDLFGNTLMHYELSGSPAIDVSNLLPGSYYMTLRTSDNVITKPFVKM